MPPGCQGCFAKAMELDASVEEAVDQCEVDPEKANASKMTCGWPELQKDSAPSALLVPASRCLSRAIKKTDELRQKFTDAPATTPLTELQKGSGTHLTLELIVIMLT